MTAAKRRPTRTDLPAADLAAADAFLADIDAVDLFAWLQVARTADRQELAARCGEKGQWAHDHLSHPVLGREALGYLSISDAVARLLGPHLPAYRQLADRRAHARRLAPLRRMALDLLEGGRLSVQAEATLRLKGRAIEAADADVTWIIDEVLFELGGRRQTLDAQQDGLARMVSVVQGPAARGMLASVDVERVGRLAVSEGLPHSFVDAVVEAARFVYPRNRPLASWRSEGSLRRSASRAPAARAPATDTPSPHADGTQDAVADFDALVAELWALLAHQELDRQLANEILGRWTRQGLSKQVVRHAMCRIAAQAATRRLAAEDPYRRLGVEPEASAMDIEAAFRRKYRWARNLADKYRSSVELAALDAARTRALDPVVRARYLQEYLAHGSAQSSMGAGSSLGATSDPADVWALDSAMWDRPAQGDP